MALFWCVYILEYAALLWSYTQKAAALRAAYVCSVYNPKKSNTNIFICTLLLHVGACPLHVPDD